MSDRLLEVLGVGVLIVIVSVLAVAIELWRRRGLRPWALEQGGTFEPGALIAGLPVPEGEAFDANLRDSHRITYRNVARIVRPEAAYVLASFQSSHRTMKRQGISSPCIVCFVTPREGTRPDDVVARAARSGLIVDAQARGGIVRIQAGGRGTRGQHQKLFEAARRWVIEAGSPSTRAP